MQVWIDAYETEYEEHIEVAICWLIEYSPANVCKVYRFNCSHTLLII